MFSSYLPVLDYGEDATDEVEEKDGTQVCEKCGVEPPPCLQLLQKRR